jgi:WD40 repeat protein
MELPIVNPNNMIEEVGYLHYLLERDFRTTKKGQKNFLPYSDNDDIQTLKVTFLAIIFLFEELIITAGDDGFLYIWKDFRIVKKQNAHSRVPILCLAASKYHINLFVSGGIDGKVNLWEMRNPAKNSSLFIIEKIFEYPVCGEIDSDTAIGNPLYHVQS